MYEVVQTLTGMISLLCAALISIVVLSSRIHEGLVIKSGLIMMALALLALGVIDLKGFDTRHGAQNAVLLLRVGMLVALLGYGWRALRTQKEAKP